MLKTHLWLLSGLDTAKLLMNRKFKRTTFIWN